MGKFNTFRKELFSFEKKRGLKILKYLYLYNFLSNSIFIISIKCQIKIFLIAISVKFPLHTFKPLNLIFCFLLPRFYFHKIRVLKNDQLLTQKSNKYIIQPRIRLTIASIHHRASTQLILYKWMKTNHEPNDKFSPFKITVERVTMSSKNRQN